MAKFEGEIGAENGKSNLQEPLLNGEFRNGESERESSKSVTSFSTAGIFSLLTFSWLNPLLSLGYEKHLNIEDVPLLPPQDRGREVYKKFIGIRQKIKSEQAKNVRSESSDAPSIASSLVRTFWVFWVATGALKTMSVVAAYVGPYLIGDFVEFLSGGRGVITEGYWLVFWFFLGNVVKSMGERYYCLGIYRLSIRVRACLTATVYEKSLRLSSIARKNRTSGEIINYMAVDVERVIDSLWWVHDLWVLPLQVTLGLAILYLNVGLDAAFAALVATVATVLANIPLTTLQGKFQEQLMGAKDARMKTTSESLRNMRILKLQ